MSPNKHTYINSLRLSSHLLYPLTVVSRPVKIQGTPLRHHWQTPPQDAAGHHRPGTHPLGLSEGLSEGHFAIGKRHHMRFSRRRFTLLRYCIHEPTITVPPALLSLAATSGLPRLPTGDSPELYSAQTDSSALETVPPVVPERESTEPMTSSRPSGYQTFPTGPRLFTFSQHHRHIFETEQSFYMYYLHLNYPMNI